MPGVFADHEKPAGHLIQIQHRNPERRRPNVPVTIAENEPMEASRLILVVRDHSDRVGSAVGVNARGQLLRVNRTPQQCHAHAYGHCHPAFAHDRALAKAMIQRLVNSALLAVGDIT